MHNAPRLTQLRNWLVILLVALIIGHTLPATPTLSAEPERPLVRPSGNRATLHRNERPRPTIEPYVRPELARQLERLRPTILAAAHRHNRPALSGMSDSEFATALTVVIYNENFGWLEDDIAPLQVFTPLYQELQREANQRLPGSNFSVWPTNLRPSVALEILNQQLPLSDNRLIRLPITVEGSRIRPETYTSREALLAALNDEISDETLAVAYLAANLERGLYRAAYDQAPVNWRTLAAWHNQGIVDPRQIRANPTARDYLRRASAYLPLARALVAPRSPHYPQLRAV